MLEPDHRSPPSLPRRRNPRASFSELYEPMGKPPAKAASARAANVYRADGLSLRAVPRHLIEWLDAVCPLDTEGGWKERSLSAITRQHQINGFDCGVACRECAERSGAADRGWSRK